MTLTERKTNPAITAMMVKTLTLPEMEKVAGGVDNGPGHKDDKSGFIDLIVDLFKKLF